MLWQWPSGSKIQTCLNVYGKRCFTWWTAHFVRTAATTSPCHAHGRERLRSVGSSLDVECRWTFFGQSKGFFGGRSRGLGMSFFFKMGSPGFWDPMFPLAALFCNFDAVLVTNFIFQKTTINVGQRKYKQPCLCLPTSYAHQLIDRVLFEVCLPAHAGLRQIGLHCCQQMYYCWHPLWHSPGNTHTRSIGQRNMYWTPMCLFPIIGSDTQWQIGSHYVYESQAVCPWLELTLSNELQFPYHHNIWIMSDTTTFISIFPASCFPVLFYMSMIYIQGFGNATFEIGVKQCQRGLGLTSWSIPVPSRHIMSSRASHLHTRCPRQSCDPTEYIPSVS